MFSVAHERQPSTLKKRGERALFWAGRKACEPRPHALAARRYANHPSSGMVALAKTTSVEAPVRDGRGHRREIRGPEADWLGQRMGYVGVGQPHVELGEVVALKFLRPEALLIPELVERFAREARAAAKIRSEHVARVFDVGTLPDGVPFIVMEHLAGQDLADVLAHGGPLPIKVAVEYVMQACEALAAAHAAGVVHRDIKPENLFLTRRTRRAWISSRSWILAFPKSRPDPRRQARVCAHHNAHRFAGVHVARANPLVRKRRCSHRHLVARLRIVRAAHGCRRVRRAVADAAQRRDSRARSNSAP